MFSGELRRRLRSLWPSCRSRASNALIVSATLGYLLALVLTVGAQQTGSGVIPVPPPLTGGGTLSGRLLGPDGSAAAPTYSFASDTDTGVYVYPGNQGIGLFASAGANNSGWYGSGLVLASSGLVSWTSGAIGASAVDVILSRLAADVLAPAAGDAYGLAAKAWIRTAPTVTSAGTSPSVVASNGTAAFTVNVGTGGTATTIVMSMPPVTTGYACEAQNQTGNAANRANQHVVQQSTTTTSVTVQNQTISTGAALAFTASDIVRFLCTAY